MFIVSARPCLHVSGLALSPVRGTITPRTVRHYGCPMFPILVSNLPPTQFTLAVDKTTGGAFLNRGDYP
jgi:hypothetical protein